MKLFLKTINKENPIVKLINVKTLSDFAVGIRVFKDGVIVEDDVQLFAPDGTELTPMEGSFGDYTAFQLQAGDGVHQDIYKVVVGEDSYPITIDIEEGTTAEIGGAGGSGPSGDFVPVEEGSTDPGNKGWVWTGTDNESGPDIYMHSESNTVTDINPGNVDLYTNDANGQYEDTYITPGLVSVYDTDEDGNSTSYVDIATKSTGKSGEGAEIELADIKDDEEYVERIEPGKLELSKFEAGTDREKYIEDIEVRPDQVVIWNEENDGAGPYNEGVLSPEMTRVIKENYDPDPDTDIIYGDYSEMKAGLMTVSKREVDSQEVYEETEMATSYVRALSVDTDETVHKSELKYDGVYVDDNGFKPVELVGTTEDDEEITFKILGYEVRA